MSHVSQLIPPPKVMPPSIQEHDPSGAAPQAIQGLHRASESPLHLQAPKRTALTAGSSIALIGLPGVGKSTLAVIASTSLKMKLVETDRCFRTMTGMTAADYVKTHGKQALLDKEFEVLSHILHKHSSQSVIAIATRTSDLPRCAKLLADFSETHAVIHVVRDFEEILRHLSGQMSEHEVLKIYRRSVPQYRSLAGYEFHVKGFADKALRAMSPQLPSFLWLKDVERDFLGFLRFIHGEPRQLRFLAPPEEADFSRVLLVPFLGSGDLPNLDDVHGVHAIQLQLRFDTIRDFDWTTLLSRISAITAALRRGCEFPLAFSVENFFGPHSDSLTNASRYFCLLQHATALGFDYNYLDLQAPRQCVIKFMNRASRTKVIGAWHNAGGDYENHTLLRWWKSHEPLAIYRMAADLGCTALQLSSRATVIQDNFDLTCFAETLRETSGAVGPTLSAFNTGDIGKLSRILNHTLTPVVISPVEHPDQCAVLDGIITIAEAQHALKGAFIVQPSEFCSFGSVISHSIAPALHNAAFSALGLPYHYGIVQSADLRDSLKLIQSNVIRGFSVANPHKQTIASLLDGVSDHARAIKAVNTVHLHQPTCGRWLVYGENTDWIGVVSCVRNYLSPINSVTPRTSALVIGAGGMAHAAVYGLLRLGVTRIFIWNRTLAQAEALAQHFSTIRNSPNEKWHWMMKECNDKVEALDSIYEIDPFRKNVSAPTIIINALSDGSNELVASNFDLPLEWFSNPTGGVYIESAYKEPNSVLMRKVQGLITRNWIGIGGKELLLEQAFPQIELWTGMVAPRDVMRKMASL